MSATVLLVDDDRLVLATVAAGLTQAGFEVLQADNGDDAILLAGRHKPRLAILDMRMPGTSGLDVARHLAAHTGTGFMFISAFGDQQIVAEATRLGALGYLVKPLEIKQIVPAVKEALARLAAIERPGAAAQSQLPSLPRTRDEWIAVGIMMERLHLDQERAIDALQAQARTERCAVEALASSVVETTNRLNSSTG